MLKQKGFSLIEVIITLLIMSIVFFGFNKMNILKESQIQKNNNQHQALMITKNIISKTSKEVFLNCAYCDTNTNNQNHQNLIENKQSLTSLPNAKLSITCVDSDLTDSIKCSLGSVHNFKLSWNNGNIFIKVLF